jgi:iron complex transport system ATP-binding protein
MLSAVEVGLTVGGARLLDGVTLDLHPGELLAVVGPNGAGKSTLVRLLSGESAPSAGRVELEGSPLATWPARELARRRAVLPQRSSLSFAFSALHVALLGRTPHAGRSRPADDLFIAREALRAAQADHLRHRSYPTLSGGEQQRVQWARVLAQIWEPPAAGARYLLLDEPTAALDLAHQLHILRTAREVARSGVALLAVLHDLNLAARFADRILLLSRGRRAALGTPREVLCAEILAPAFGLEVLVTTHPGDGLPLVVPSPGAAAGLVSLRSSKESSCSISS